MCQHLIGLPEYFRESFFSFPKFCLGKLLRVSERSERSAMPSNRHLIYRLARSARRLLGCMGMIWNMPASKFTSQECLYFAGKLFLPRIWFSDFFLPNRVFGAICVFSTYAHYSKVEICSPTIFGDDFDVFLSYSNFMIFMSSFCLVVSSFFVSLSSCLVIFCLVVSFFFVSVNLPFWSRCRAL